MSDNSGVEELLEEAWNQRRVGAYEKALDCLKQAEQKTQNDDHNSLGRIFHVYAQFQSDRDNFPKALELYKQSQEFYRKAENTYKIAHSTRHIADIQRKLGNFVESEKNYRKAIGTYKANRQTYVGDLANALRGFALVLESCDKISEAITAWQETMEMYGECKLQAGVDEAKQKLDNLRA